MVDRSGRPAIAPGRGSSRSSRKTEPSLKARACLGSSAIAWRASRHSPRLQLLQAGDHVDVVGTYTVHPPDGQSDFDVSRIIVRDLVVLRAPASDGAAGGLTASSDKSPVILSVRELRSRFSQAE